MSVYDDLAVYAEYNDIVCATVYADGNLEYQNSEGTVYRLSAEELKIAARECHARSALEGHFNEWVEGGGFLRVSDLLPYAGQDFELVRNICIDAYAHAVMGA